jgi:hypothetical protein
MKIADEGATPAATAQQNATRGHSAVQCSTKVLHKQVTAFLHPMLERLIKDAYKAMKTVMTRAHRCSSDALNGDAGIHKNVMTTCKPTAQGPTQSTRYPGSYISKKTLDAKAGAHLHGCAT